MKVLSPLTGNEAKFIERFPSGKIIDLYKNDFKIDVSEYFSAIQFVEVYECNDTAYRFYYPFNLAGKSDFYQKLFSNRKLYYPGWKLENQIASKYISGYAKVLDVGCGDGSFLHELIVRKKCEVEGLELNPDAVKAGLSKGLNLHCLTVQEYLPGHQETFDVVTSFQVLEHIQDVKSFLDAKLKLLKAGGLLIIGVPYNYPYLYHNDKFETLNLPPHHMGLWNLEAFKKLQNLFNIKMEAYHISKIHDVLFYASIQVGLKQKYNRFFWRNKVTRLACRIINKILSPLKYFIKGHDIVVIFKKN